MLMTEYDYNLDVEVQREEAAEEAARITERKKDIKVIRKLYAKGWSLTDIADFVEIPEVEVAEVIRNL